MTTTHAPPAAPPTTPTPDPAVPATAPVEATTAAPTSPRPVAFRRLIVFDSLADAVGCGAHA